MLSEKGSEPDIRPRRFNVSEVPLADIAITWRGFDRQDSLPWSLQVEIGVFTRGH
jgi:hypothetical protein